MERKGYIGGHPKPPAGRPLHPFALNSKLKGRTLMKANCWMGNNKVQVREVPDPKILNQRDAIVRITSTAICGSDLHIYDGYIPSMKKGDILGHEFMGEVVEVAKENGLKKGDRVVVPFT